MNELRILIVGLGSIGQRHARLLLAHEGVKVAALRSGLGQSRTIDGVLNVISLNECWDFDPHAVIISNPTSEHVDSALPFLERGIRTLLEKPVADSSGKALVLEPFAEICRVAYCYRFLPLAAFLRELLSQARCVKLTFRRSYYLPFWHPSARYQEEYAARRGLGGGVVRTLSHEIDLMIHLFGKPTSVTGVIDKISSLEIDVDDFAFFTCKTTTGARVNFELDFLSPVNLTEGELVTDLGRYAWTTDTFTFVPYDSTRAVAQVPSGLFALDFDLMYRKQVEDFLRFAKGQSSDACTLYDACAVLEVIEAIDEYDT